jgi:hypothetical protein
VMVSITTMATSMDVPRFMATRDRGQRNYPLAFPPLLALALLTVLFWRHRKPRARWIPAMSFTILLGVVMAMAACGEGSSTTSPRRGGTSAGSYAITVTGSFASGSTTLTHTTKLTLVVQ